MVLPILEVVVVMVVEMVVDVVVGGHREGEVILRLPVSVIQFADITPEMKQKLIFHFMEQRVCFLINIRR